MRLLIILIIAISLPFLSKSQGCSDAGLCTISGLDSGYGNGETQTNAKYSTIFGLGEQNVFHVTTQFEINIPTFKNHLVQIKMPYNFTFGNLGNISGLGDLSLSVNQRVYSTDVASINFVAGIKIPANEANIRKGGFPLPMAYQTSLGTYDMILGMSTNLDSWHISFGYQHSFGHNLNEFEHRYDNPANFNNYNESYHLQRADDIMVRVEKIYTVNSYKLLFGVLPIYHLWEDKIMDGQKVDGSSGLTLNLNAAVEKKFKNDIIMNIILAAPIIDREVRPDGLTRSFVVVVSFLKAL